MTADQNEAKTKRLYQAVWNERQLELIEEWVSADFVGHHTAYPEPLLGIDAFRGFVEDVITAFPDVRMTVHETIAAGDRVASRITMSGTHHGELLGYRPTGLPVSVEFIGIERYRDGLCCEEWVNSDDIGLARQIRALPAQGSLADRAAMRLHAIGAWRTRRNG